MYFIEIKGKLDVLVKKILAKLVQKAQLN